MEVGGVIFGDDQAAAGFFVQTMDDAGPGDAADAAEAAGAMMEQGVDQGARGMAGGGMDDNPGGLVQGQQVVVLVEYFQGNVLRSGRGRRGAGPGEGDDFAGAG